jgi:hypothetical protein
VPFRADDRKAIHAAACGPFVTATSKHLPNVDMKEFSRLDDLARCVVLHVARDERLGADGRGAVRAGDAKEQQEDARSG